jgi:exonuclease SbcD
MSEANQQKGVWIVDTATEPVSWTFRPITPIRDVQQLTASFEDLLDPEQFQELNFDDFFGIVLTDTQPIPNVLAQLRERYPNIVTLGRQDGFQTQVAYQGESGQQMRQMDPMTLLADFYEQVAQEPLTKQQQQWASDALKQANEEEK